MVYWGGKYNKRSTPFELELQNAVKLKESTNHTEVKWREDDAARISRRLNLSGALLVLSDAAELAEAKRRNLPAWVHLKESGKCQHHVGKQMSEEAEKSPAQRNDRLGHPSIQIVVRKINRRCGCSSEEIFVWHNYINGECLCFYKGRKLI